MTGRRLHVLVAVVLVACLVSPFVEMGFHSTTSIFRTGRDRETTVALLLLLIELAFALAKVLVELLAGLVDKERVISLHRPPITLSELEESSSISLPGSSPPILLRI